MSTDATARRRKAYHFGSPSKWYQRATFLHPIFQMKFRTIRQVDPNFTQDNFVRFLEKEMIPIILEAAAMNDQEVIEDWALDAPSQKLLLSHNAAKKGTIRISNSPFATEMVHMISYHMDLARFGPI